MGNNKRPTPWILRIRSGQEIGKPLPPKFAGEVNVYKKEGTQLQSLGNSIQSNPIRKGNKKGNVHESSV